MVEVTASPPLRIAGATSYAVLSVLSLSLNAVLVTIFVKHRKDYLKTSFYLLTWQLIVGDVLTQAVQLVVAVPITYTALPLYGGGLLLHILAGIDTIAYAATLIFSILMTFSRAAIFLLPKVYRNLFETNIHRTIVACWLLVFGVLAGLNASGCYKIFVTNGFYMTHLCETLFAQNVKGAWYNFTTYAPVTMIVIYLGIFTYLRYVSATYTGASGGNDAASSRERRLLFQFFPLLVAKDTQWEYVVNFVSNWISIGNNTMTPIVLFAFNGDVRRRLKEFLGFGTSKVASERSNSVTAVQMQNFCQGRQFVAT